MVRLLVSQHFCSVQDKHGVNMIFQLHFIEQVAIFNKTLLSLTKKQTSAFVSTQCSNSKELRTLSRDRKRIEPFKIMAHTLSTQTCIFCLTVVILQLRHKVATAGFGRSKPRHKDAPILKEECSHYTYFDACPRSDPMMIHPACTPYRLVWQTPLLLTCCRHPVSTPS